MQILSGPRTTIYGLRAVYRLQGSFQSQLPRRKVEARDRQEFSCAKEVSRRHLASKEWQLSRPRPALNVDPCSALSVFRPDGSRTDEQVLHLP